MNIIIQNIFVIIFGPLFLIVPLILLIFWILFFTMFRKKKSVKKNIIRALMIITIIYILLISSFAFLLYQETRENDRLPIVFGSQVKMERVNDQLYNSSEYKFGEDCLKTASDIATGPAEFKKSYGCKMFKTDDGTFYWSGWGSGEQSIVFEKLDGRFETLIKDNGTYGKSINNSSGYPGTSSFEMKGNGKDVIFIYTGWNNPRKTLRLSPY